MNFCFSLGDKCYISANIALIAVTAILACYIGETKRWFETRKKEHMWVVKNGDNNATALSKHAVQLGHSIDWKNYEILQIETDYRKRKFIESFYINSLFNVLNDKKSVCFPSIYQNLFS